MCGGVVSLDETGWLLGKFHKQETLLVNIQISGSCTNTEAKGPTNKVPLGPQCWVI